MALDAAQFARTLEIPALVGRPGLALEAAPAEAVDVEKPSAALIKGQVQSFSAGLSGQDRQDIEYITLAAQLNSDVKVPNNDSLDGVKAWFRNYSSVMSNLGMIMDFDWEEFRASSQGLSVDAVIVSVLAAVASQNGAAIAKAAMDAIAKLPKDGERLRLFSNSTTGSKAGKFLLGTCAQEKGSISMAFGAFGMDYKTRDTTVLWFNWKSSDVAIYKNQKVATFNQDYYAKGARATLEAKLAGHAATYVANLDLGF